MEQWFYYIMLLGIWGAIIRAPDPILVGTLVP